MRRIAVLIILLQVFLASCDENHLDEIQSGCYFQYEYVNYAWGFSHAGFTITSEGEVFSFDESTPWVFAENGKLSLSALRKNIKASVQVDTLIGVTEMEHSNQLAISAISGKLTEPVSGGADMGLRICKIIIPDTTDPLNGYREVILTENGDFERHNPSPEAAVIASWLTAFKFH